MIRPTNRPVDERGGMDWLGPEFLTWLWWRASTDPAFVDRAGDRFFVHVEEFLELRGERGAARKTTLRAGMPGASAEGKVALRNGKVVTGARLLVAHGEDETTLTVRAEDLDLSSVRPPAPEGDRMEDRTAATLVAIRRAYADVDACFSAFLDVRCSPRWEAEAERVRAFARAPSEEERSLAGG
jgi:hypothetical protein